MADEGKTIIHVTVEAGAEFVQEKHVGYQIGKVEAGGIGVQVVQGGQLKKQTEGAGKAGFKVVSNVFTYKWTKQHPERITDFYQYLVKLRAIDQDTDHEEFEKLFTGVPTDIIVKWLAPKSALKALMSELKTRKYISPAGRIWVITESHFKDKDNHMYSRLRNEHDPDYLAWIIAMIADTLEPKKEVKQINMLDDDVADELWSGIKDKGWEMNR